MTGLKPKALALLLALCLLLLAGPAYALTSEPAAQSEVAPGDTITYAYTLPAAQDNCVLRLSLGPGLVLREDSVKVESKSEPEIIYGSDGFVMMADRLEEGDSIAFAADVSSAAKEIWARLSAGDESIPEEEGYAAHILVLPAQASDTAAQAAEAQGENGEKPDAGRPAVNTTNLWLLLGIAVVGGGAALGNAQAARRRRKQAGAPAEEAASAQPSTASPLDTTVEYVTIPEDGVQTEQES